MGRLACGLVTAIRRYCDLECHIDRLLLRAGYHRRFHSQKGQDRWIITEVFGRRRGGFFVEIGAANGVTHSNTYVLERDYGWQGLLVEANPVFASELRLYRRAQHVIACVDAEAQRVKFFKNGYMGGIIDTNTDNSRRLRSPLLDRDRTSIVGMESVRLDELLRKMRTPKTIDYLSIDVEGAEDRVLRGLSFEAYTVNAITVERPSSETHSLLDAAGFTLAKCNLWEGFYLSHTIASCLGIERRDFVGLPRKPF